MTAASQKEASLSSTSIVTLRLLFVAILAAMLVSTTWASIELNVVEGVRLVLASRWGLATLLDAYFAFLTFFVWVAWRERTIPARFLWFVLIMLLGNIAMASYILLQLHRLPKGGSMRELLVGMDGR